MQPKYTEPCPHCGQDMERKPTLTERVYDHIESGLSMVYHIVSKSDYWPGTNSLTNRVMQSLSDAGIRFVEDTAMANEFGRGYVAGLEAARALCQNVGSPATAQITATIADWKEKNK